MIEYFSTNLWFLWLIIAILCLLLELTTGGFYILCFSIGAFITSIISLTGIPFLYQFFIFCITSGLCIFLVRPTLNKLSLRNNTGEDRKSNADAVVGKEGKVIETIESNETGWVMVYGDQWKAKSTDGTKIEKGTQIKVIKRDSLTIYVEKV